MIQLNVGMRAHAIRMMRNIMLTKFILFHSKIDYVQVSPAAHRTPYRQTDFYAASYNETVQNCQEMTITRIDGGTAVEQR